MDIQKLNAFTGINQIQTRNLVSQSKQASQMIDKLSGEEENMINTQFSHPSPKALELYRATGEARVEQPQSKGINIDFRV